MQVEYKIVELDLPAEITAAITNSFLGTPLPTEIRKAINVLVQNELNQLGKKGWLLHNSGLATLPTLLVYKTKGVRNVR